MLATGVVAARRTGESADAPERRLYFLRRIPRDPFWPDASTPAAQTWMLRSYASPAEAPQPGADVFDVMSASRATGFDGTAYDTW